MKTLTREKTFNGHPLAGTNSYIEILQSMDSLLKDMITHHNKVFFIRFDLTFPTDLYYTYPKDNSLLSRFFEALTLHCKRRGYALRYCWARETSPTTLQHHYHCFLALNGNVIQSTHGLLNQMISLWGGCLDVDAGGLVHLCPNKEGLNQSGGIMIVRTAHEFPLVYEAVFKMASYMAKQFSKSGAPKHIREFGLSRY